MAINVIDVQAIKKILTFVTVDFVPAEVSFSSGAPGIKTSV